MATPHPTKNEEVYHLRFNLRGEDFTDEYEILPSNKLSKLPGDMRIVQPATLIPIRTITRQDKSGKFLDYNPRTEVEPGISIWLFGHGALNKLDWDPAEWRWRQQGKMKATLFFQYKAKRGYQIGMNLQQVPMRFDSELTNLGYSQEEKTKFYQKLWHSWKPRKISPMNWLTLGGGLPVGEW